MAIYGRCGNCMQPYSAHRTRLSAPPICRDHKVYREATEEELAAGYAAAFPDGPKPIATFRADDPASVERAKSVLSPDALRKFFGPGGSGIDAFVKAMEHAGLTETGSPIHCSLGVGCDEYGVCYALAHGQPEMCPAQGTEAGTAETGTGSVHDGPVVEDHAPQGASHDLAQQGEG